MAKFMILYNSPESATDTMANASPEEMKASMEEWIKWRDEASKTAKIDFGLPLQAISRITPDGIGESDSHVSGYSIVEGESKDAVMELLQTHPHLKRPGASMDALEMLPMPGL